MDVFIRIVAFCAVLSGVPAQGQDVLGAAGVVPAAPLTVGPIEGFTAGWHEAPASLTVPRGVDVTFEQPKAPLQHVAWQGADEVGVTESVSRAVFSSDVPGRYRVVSTVELPLGVSVGAELASDVCIVDVVERVPVSLASLAPITVDQGPEWEGHLTNEETMAAFFGESVALVDRLAADRYVTSIQKTLTFRVSIHDASSWPIEWSVDGVPVGLGDTWQAKFVEPGMHVVAATRAGVEQQVDMETYSVTIAPSEEFVVGQPLRFRATTEPPGHESRITWMSSTKTGTAAPVLGHGPTFTAVFETDVLDGSWTGVKADDAVVESDGVTCPVDEVLEAAAGADLRLELAPIAGLTTAWHEAPSSTHVPVGVELTLSADVVLRGDADADGIVSHLDTEVLRRHMGAQGLPDAWRADVDGNGLVDGFDFGGIRELYGATLSPDAQRTITWSGARVSATDSARAVVTFDRAGEYVVSAAAVVDGVVLTKSVTFTAVDVDPADVRFTITGVEPVDPSDGTVFSFVMGSPAVIEEVDGTLATSVGRAMRLSVEATPVGFEPLAEWATGETVFERLGDDVVVSLDRRGGHVVTAGCETSLDGIPIVAFETIIEPSPHDGELYDGTPVVLYARTEPAGFEDLICWRASTLFGHVETELGRGPVFTTTFHDTMSVYGDRWVNIRACDAVFDVEALLAPKCADYCCGCASALDCVGKALFDSCNTMAGPKNCMIKVDCGLILKCCRCS